MKTVKIEWLGHACFKIYYDNYTVVLDPYADNSVDGLSNIRTNANRVYCSHLHYDHNAVDCVELNENQSYSPMIYKVNTFHDDAKGQKRGENTVHIFDFDGIKVAHFGDLGHTLSIEQIKEIGKIDIALLPIGGFYTIDSKTAKSVFDSIDAKIMIPMHYRSDNFGFNVIEHIDNAIKIFDNAIYTNSYEFIYDDTKKGVYVLTPKNIKK